MAVSLFYLLRRRVDAVCGYRRDSELGCDRIDRTLEMDVLRLGRLRSFEIHPIERKPSALDASGFRCSVARPPLSERRAYPKS